MQCEVARRAIEAVAEGCIDDAVREDLLAHAGSCPACEGLLDEALSLPEPWETALRATPEPPSAISNRLARLLAGPVSENCWSFLPDLPARLDGELEVAKALALDAHIAGCAECARERDLLALADETSRSLRVEPRAEFLSALLATVDPSLRKSARLAQLRSATAAAAAVAVVALGLGLLRAANAPEPAPVVRSIASAPAEEQAPPLTSPSLPEPLEPARLAGATPVPEAKVGGTSQFEQASMTVMNAPKHNPRRAPAPSPRATAPASTRGAARPAAPSGPPAGRSAEPATEDRGAARDAGPLGLALEGWQRVVESLPSRPDPPAPRGGAVVVDAVAVQGGSTPVEPAGYATLY